MSESYTVAARLNMASNVPEVIAQMMRGFGQVNAAIMDTQEHLSGIAAEVRTLATGSRGIGRLVASMKELGSIRVGGAALDDMERMSSLTRELTEQQVQLARAVRENAAAWGQMGRASTAAARGTALAPAAAAAGRGGRRQRATGAHPVDWMGAAYGLQAGGDAGASFLERSITAEMEVQQQLAQFRMNASVGDADIQRVRAKAEALAHTIRGSTIAENLHTILDAYTITGSLGEALAGSEGMAKLRYLIANLPGQHRGDQAFAAAQAAELMQRFYDPRTHQVDMAAMNQQIGAMAQVVAGTGGRADPSRYLGFAKQSRIGGMVANDQFLYRDLPAMLIALAGSRAGTGEAATFQQFVTGTMTRNAANALKGAGLLDRNAAWKGGRVQDMGKHFHGLDVYATNPVEWVREYMLDPKNGVLARNHVDPNDRIAMARFLSSWSARQTGLGFMAEMTLGMGGINKEAGKIGQTTANPLGVVQQFDPFQKLREFHAAENELLVTLGQGAMGPALEALKSLTGVLHDLSDWGKAHPNAAKDIVLVAGATSVLAKAIGELGMVVFIGAPVLKGFGALATAAEGLPGPFGKAAAGMNALLGPLRGLIALGAGAAAAKAGVDWLGKKIWGPKAYEDPGAASGFDLFDPKTWSGADERTRQYLMQQHGGMVRPPASGGATVRPQSYIAPPQTARVIHASFTIPVILDGREVGRAVTTYQTTAASRPSAGPSGFNLGIGLPTAGVLA